MLVFFEHYCIGSAFNVLWTGFYNRQFSFANFTLQDSMMKQLLFFTFCLLFFAHAAVAQVFNFPQTSTTIIKTTAQSPAHWYIEIENLANVDTILRWKADCSNIPAGWTISFDDQNNYYTNVHTGDSADFILYDSLSIPQKLIIGAATNNIAASASVFMEVYIPGDTAPHQVIEYQFVITPATGIESISGEQEIQFLPGAINCSFKVPTQCSIVSLTGQTLFSGRIEKEILKPNLHPGIYFLHVGTGDNRKIKRFVW
jgi:hypothetical protein